MQVQGARYLNYGVQKPVAAPISPGCQVPELLSPDCQEPELWSPSRLPGTCTLPMESTCWLRHLLFQTARFLNFGVQTARYLNYGVQTVRYLNNWVQTARFLNYGVQTARFLNYGVQTARYLNYGVQTARDSYLINWVLLPIPVPSSPDWQVSKLCSPDCHVF
jgi:hypothetical protein